MPPTEVIIGGIRLVRKVYLGGISLFFKNIRLMCLDFSGRLDAHLGRGEGHAGRNERSSGEQGGCALAQDQQTEGAGRVIPARIAS